MEKNIDKAVDLINEEKFIEAQTILKLMLDDNPVDVEVLKNLGLCEVNLDNHTGAADIFKKVIELNPNDILSKFYYASCLTTTGKKEQAIAVFKDVIKERPDYVEAYKNLGMIYIEFAQVENAIEIMELALKNDNIELDYSSYYILATAYMLKKDNINSIKYLEAALELNPNHLQMLNSLAVCYAKASNNEKSKEILEKALKIDENNSLTLFNLGNYYQSIKNYKTALEYYNKSYAIEPSAAMLTSMAECALKAQDYILACNLYKSLIAAYPNNAQYRHSYITALEMTSNYKEALENVELLLATDAKNVSLIKKKGTYQRKLERYEDSISTFSVLLKRGKIDVETYYNLGFDYVELQDFDKAKDMFKKCTLLEPNNPYAHKDLGVLYLKMNCYDWAVDEMKKAIELEDDIPEFHYSLAVSYLMLNNVDLARKSFNATIKLDKNYADAYAYLGYIDLLEKNINEATKALQDALKIDTNNFLAKTFLAKYYFSISRHTTAKALLIDVVEKIKDDDTLNMLAICYMETGEEENAMGIFSKLLLKYPENHILLTNLAKCELKANKTKEAQEHIRQALLIFEDYEPALELMGKIQNGK